MPGGGGRPPAAGPTQSSPTQNRVVGPRAGGDDDSQIQVTQRAEPTAQTPVDPLAVPADVKERIGSDWDGLPASPRAGATLRRKYLPYYEERRGDYRFRMLPPFWFEHTRGLTDPSSPGPLEDIPTKEDRESLYGLLYYQRRSPSLDVDALFPALWHVRDGESHTTVVGPVVHREAPGENDTWVAPIFFSGSRPDGGYFHSPALLTTSHWSAKGAFTLAGVYFRDRAGSDVDMGVAPFFFHGDNGNLDGAHKSYTLIPPLLFYRRAREVDDNTLTIVGPVVAESNPKRDIFDVAPLFFHIHGKPETGGVHEDHTTLFPFFHYGHKEDTSLLVLPGFLRRVTKDTDTLLTPFYSHATTRNGATSLTTIGPVLPLYFNYSDRDIGLSSFAVAPFFYQLDSPVGHDWLTPLVGRFETYGSSKTWWMFPSLTLTTDLSGWSANIYPLFFMGRDKESAHTVIAPFFWDFASPKKRTTVAAPLFWRFSDATDDSITQLAGNTLYMQKRVAGGLSWEFHFLPVFSYGETPNGYWWNVLFGLAGYDREGSYARIKAFWAPIQVSGPASDPR